MTLELEDRYVICPLSPGWSSEHLKSYGAKPVADGFRYSSDSNTEWLDGRALSDLIKRKAA